MTKAENGKKYALIAAICYAIYALVEIIWKTVIIALSWKYVSTGSVTIIFAIIWCVSTLGMVITLFMKNPKAVLIAAGLKALLIAFSVATDFSLRNLFYFFAFGSLIFFVVLTLKGNVVVKKIWFVPASIMLLGCIGSWIDGSESILMSGIEIAAFAFAGMWLKENVAPAQAAPINKYATVNPQSVHSSLESPSNIGGADKLKVYKELLESGIITQEEFDTKKKQVLGL